MDDHVDAIVEQWRRERPELDVSTLALFGRLFRVAQLADADLSARLRPYDLQPGWFDLLAALRRSGAPFALNPTELMRTTLLSSGGITKRVDRLAAGGLVERAPDPNDRRGTLIRLTPRGVKVIDRALVLHLENEEQLLYDLSLADRRALDGLLRKLLAGLVRSDAASG